jgi:CDP-paratose 2-epimerase
VTGPPRLLITGGAGFVGANLGVSLAARHPDWELIALDNLYRRGSELNLPRLEAAGVRFVRGDVRDADALLALEPIDALIECSAEPTALMEPDADTSYPVHTNLLGAYNCLELARRDGAQFVFLSTSRVYPFGALRRIAYREGPTRLELKDEQELGGVSRAGISEGFPLEGPRTLYGATKLAAELLIEEYGARFEVRTVVNRCGVIAGPWQMGRVDQGVFAFWVFHHLFRLPLRYIGFGGGGKQVRDLLHVEDLADLVDAQLTEPDRWAGVVANVGGGLERSLSLAETTKICREMTGNEVEIARDSEDRYGDVPIYVSDCTRLHSHTDWRPSRNREETLSDIHAWARDNAEPLSRALGLPSAA